MVRHKAPTAAFITAPATASTWAPPPPPLDLERRCTLHRPKLHPTRPRPPPPPPRRTNPRSAGTKPAFNVVVANFAVTPPNPCARRASARTHMRSGRGACLIRGSSVRMRMVRRAVMARRRVRTGRPRRQASVEHRRTPAVMRRMMVAATRTRRRRDSRARTRERQITRTGMDPARDGKAMEMARRWVLPTAPQRVMTRTSSWGRRVKGAKRSRGCRAKLVSLRTHVASWPQAL